MNTQLSIPNYSAYLLAVASIYFIGLKFLMVVGSSYDLYNNPSTKTLYSFLGMSSWYIFGFWSTFNNIIIMGLHYFIINYQTLLKNIILPPMINEKYNMLLEYKNMAMSNDNMQMAVAQTTSFANIINNGTHTLINLVWNNAQPLLQKVPYFNSVLEYYNTQKKQYDKYIKNHSFQVHPTANMLEQQQATITFYNDAFKMMLGNSQQTLTNPVANNMTNKQNELIDNSLNNLKQVMKLNSDNIDKYQEEILEQALQDFENIQDNVKEKAD